MGDQGTGILVAPEGVMRLSDSDITYGAAEVDGRIYIGAGVVHRAKDEGVDTKVLYQQINL